MGPPSGCAACRLRDRTGPPVPITIEIVVLALASTVRPTSLAAVYALARDESPRWLMTVYVAAGLAFTVSFGLLIIFAFKGIDVSAGSSETKTIAEIAGGVLVIAFGLGVLSGRIGGRRAQDAPSVRGRWEGRVSRRMTTKTAVLAGPATHIPGLLYLIALDLIVASQRGFPAGFLELVIYNTIWFALPIGALAICVIDPPAARRAVEAVQAWSRAHTRVLVLTISFGVGTAMVISGILGA